MQRLNTIVYDGVLLGLLATALFDVWMRLQKQLGGVASILLTSAAGSGISST